LAVHLGDMKTAYELALEAGSEQKWKQLAELATAESKFGLAQECLHKAQDFGGLLLLATSAGEKACASDVTSACLENLMIIYLLLSRVGESVLEVVI
jgi:coatomer subunit beta'